MEQTGSDRGRRARCLSWLRDAAITLAVALALLAGPLVEARAQSTKMGLLLPDAANLATPAVQAWIDGVKEHGYELVVYRNSQFLVDGTSAVLKYRGIIVPDEVQQSMTDELVTAIKSYVQGGGRLMLVYDAGALDARGFYPIPRSRFSDLVGVEYVLYEELRDRTIGLGPVEGTVRAMRSLVVPPGKSMPSSAELAAQSLVASSAGETTFLRSGRGNAGGVKGYDHDIYHEKVKKPKKNGDKDKDKDKDDKSSKIKHGNSFAGERVPGATRPPPNPPSSPPAPGVDPDDAYLATAEPGASDTIHAVVGYGYGALSYPSFVTRGAFDGETILSSDVHGLVAGVRSYGQGRVMFVNLPLSYLKRQTDGMLLHGFVELFARRHLGLPRLAQVPNGVAGLVLNWHLDSMAAQTPTLRLRQAGIFDGGPFSIHMTAGPDTIVPGDGLGWNLPGNATAQSLLQWFHARGHHVASHGGWIHDYYGANANETNEAQFKQYLVLNDDAVTAVIGHPATEYSAPEGNNPLWAMNWLEQKGVVGYYFLGHTGMGPTRSWRADALRNPSMWAVPLLTYGSTATYEEWQELGFQKSEIVRWHDALLAFGQHRVAVRQIYAHPPGADLWRDVLTDLLDKAGARQKSGTFRWYTMTRLARFMTERAQVAWTTTRAANGATLISASHPTSLQSMAWVYKKSLYAQPQVVSGSATVTETATDWVVRAGSGTSVSFQAMPLP